MVDGCWVLGAECLVLGALCWLMGDGWWFDGWWMTGPVLGWVIGDQCQIKQMPPADAGGWEMGGWGWVTLIGFMLCPIGPLHDDTLAHKQNAAD